MQCLVLHSDFVVIRPYQNSDIEPRTGTKHRIGLIHNAPICLKVKSLTSEAWLLLNLYRLSLANFKLKRIAASSRGFLAAPGIPRRQPHCRSGVATLPSVGAIP